MLKAKENLPVPVNPVKAPFLEEDEIILNLDTSEGMHNFEEDEIKLNLDTPEGMPDFEEDEIKLNLDLSEGMPDFEESIKNEAYEEENELKAESESVAETEESIGFKWDIPVDRPESFKTKKLSSNWDEFKEAIDRAL